MDQLTAPVDIDGAWQPPRLAAGVSRYPTDGTTMKDVMDCARTALGKVTLAPGEPAFRFYSQRSHARVLRKFEQIRRLADALAAESLDQVYQPFIDIQTGQVTGFEALARWHDAIFGDVSPSVFVPLADADPVLSHALMSWSLDTACAQLAALNCKQPNRLQVSVNISGAELLRHDFVETLFAILLHHQVRADQVILELTEKSLLTNTDAGIARMNRLRADGIQFAVDDFGTGYSALGYLKRLPLDMVKIDRCFVQDVADDPVASALTRGIIDISRTLGLKVIAEGIETQAELTAISALSCDLGQGFLLGRPESAERLLQQLRERNGWD